MNMSKIKEINIKTTDGDWWRVMVNDIAATKDGTIANRILAETSVPAGKIWGESMDFIDKPVFINTANIIAIEVIRENEEE